MSTYLKSSRRVSNNISSMSQCSARLVFSLCSNHLDTSVVKMIHILIVHLCPGIPGSLSLCSHGSHQLFRNSDILHLDSLHRHSPRISGFMKQVLHLLGYSFSAQQDTLNSILTYYP